MFQERMCPFLESGTDWNVLQNPVWKEPTPFCTMMLIDNALYLPVHDIIKFQHIWSAQKNNVDLKQTDFPNSTRTFKYYNFPGTRF